MIASIIRKTAPVLISGGLWFLTLGAASFAAEPDSDTAEAPTISLFDGIRSGVLKVSGEGTGGDQMNLSVTNRSTERLRVVLPPGLLASGATGQAWGLVDSGVGVLAAAVLAAAVVLAAVWGAVGSGAVVLAAVVLAAAGVVDWVAGAASAGAGRGQPCSPPRSG